MSLQCPCPALALEVLGESLDELLRLNVLHGHDLAALLRHDAARPGQSCTSGRLEVVVKHLDGHVSGAVANRDIREVVSTAAKLEPNCSTHVLIFKAYVMTLVVQARCLLCCLHPTTSFFPTALEHARRRLEVSPELL